MSGARLLARRPAGLLALLVVVVVVTAGIIVAVRHFTSAACGAARVESPLSPLQDPVKMKARPNEARDKISDAVAAMGPPFGPVAAGADYYYDQYLHLYGVAGGVLAWTKNNAPVTYLDDVRLTPRWSVQPTSKRTAWDTSASKFLLLDLSASKPGQIAEFDLTDGRPGWCVDLSGTHRDGEPVGTTFLEGGDVVTALPDGDRIRVTRLDAADGSEHWSKTYDGTARADFVGTLTDRLLLVGGVEEYRLAQTAPQVAEPSKVLSAIDAATGSTAWTWGPDRGENVHVIGVRDGTTWAMVRGLGGPVLTALGPEGRVSWEHGTMDGGYEATLRGDVVVVDSPKALDAYDARTGELRWTKAIPSGRTYFPYGFTLGQMPSLDADHVLMPTTSSLELLDLRDGSTLSYALPTDGVSTTYWPYQLLVTPRHLGVVANTGAILATRE